MERRLILTADPIQIHSVIQSSGHSGKSGAVVHFAGLVRDLEGDQLISAIDYEAFEEMAERQFHKLFDVVEQRWPVESIVLIHRIGVVQVDQPSLWVEVAAPHRQEAFAACQWLIDAMKRVVPIWKRPLPVPR